MSTAPHVQTMSMTAMQRPDCPHVSWSQACSEDSGLTSDCGSSLKGAFIHRNIVGDIIGHSIRSDVLR